MMNKSRNVPYFNRSVSNGSNDLNFPSNFENNAQSAVGDKPTFSSLFALANGNNRSIPTPNIEPFPTESSTNDDDGVYLQISNLEQWYGNNDANLRNYLMSQLKPITPILSLTIETPSIAKVKVPSIQVSEKGQKARSASAFNCFCSFSSPNRSCHTCIARRWATSAFSFRS